MASAATATIVNSLNSMAGALDCVGQFADRPVAAGVPRRLRAMRLRPLPGEAGVIGQRIFVLCAGIALPACGTGQDQPGRCGEQRPAKRAQARSVAPVFLPTSATILATAASISASVSVRSRGCRVTAIATDFEPSGTPAPR